MQHFATIAAPLSSLLANRAKADNDKLEWGNEQQEAFDALRTALTTAPCLSLPNFELPFVVETDASDVAMGATLAQEYSGSLQPVCYFSRKFTPTELRYHTGDREILAIFASCMKWRCYL